MEHKLATDEIREQAALYALGALSQIEARAFENHLADGCQVCQAEVSGFDGVVGELGLAAPPASPPLHLRDLLTARIAKEPRQISSREGARTQAMPAVSARVARPSPWIAALPWAIAACVAIVAVSSVLGLRRVVRSTNQELAQMRVDMLRVNELLGQAIVRNSEYVQMISLLEKPGSSHIFLAGQPDVSPESKAFIAWDKPGNKWVVMADMTPAPAGKVYQLWFLKDGAAPRSAGLVKTDQSGHGHAEVDVPPDIGKISAAAMTLEPEGGSAQPTLPPFVAGKAD